jgi:hypothetical protein
MSAIDCAMPGVVPVADVTVTASEDADGVDRCVDGLSCAVEAGRASQPRRPAAASPCWECRPNRSIATDEFLLHHGDRQAAGPGARGHAQPDRPGTDHDHVIGASVGHLLCSVAHRLSPSEIICRRQSC